ncbi:CHAT domain-containing protein [Actinacidiphila sp. DG2A-62]|uniref:CHAT domain-containing protein n=1 Tax=Actinacidiphila sp. DG2A-62 TaxID=3108821 RepID=UPI002DBD2716|nr:CHAT domain-containing protein [Actinacidiphila sp. DG2A-62]MEC3994098.1 CHAT domain-containing protein [Actinacidiphila sp. DG2A-62]
MGLFSRGRDNLPEAQRQAGRLRERFRQSGPTKDIVDESWRQMLLCADELMGGDERFARLLLDTAHTSFVLHAETGQWLVAVASALQFGVAVASIEVQSARDDTPFPEQLWPAVQDMTDLAVEVAHRARVPLAGCLIAESLTTRRFTDRMYQRELSAILGEDDVLRRLRAIVASQREQLAAAREPLPEAPDSAAALRAHMDDLLLHDLDAAVAGGAGRSLFAGTTAVPAVLAASTTGRSVVFVAPGLGQGAAFRLEGPETGRDLCESVQLPRLGRAAVREQARRVREVLRSDERRTTVRGEAIDAALKAVSEAVWEPVFDAWPDLRDGRVALVPLGASASLPLFTAPVDGAPVCGGTDLTVVPSGRSLMVAGAWPRSPRQDPLVAADPWYADGAGAVPIPCTVAEARAVAAVHGVAPHILREAAVAPGGGAGAFDRLRTIDRPPAADEAAGADDLVRRISAANLIHLAGHGHLDGDDPLRSALLLGRPLPLSALLDHDLRRGTTIVLSACHLADVGTAQTSEQLGFPGAMLAMGASSVIAALWPVPDSSDTVTLMTYLHEELRTATPSAALGHAVTRAAADGMRAAVWAPFVHFGA